jgi:shikimate kinase
MFGGAVLTDNERKRIISWADINPSLKVLFLVPTRRIEKSSLRREDFMQARDLVIKAFEMAHNGHIAEAITLNGRAYAPILGVDTGPVDAAIAAGAWAAGMTGTGPAIAVLVDPKVEEEVLAALTPYPGIVIKTSLNNSPARLLTEEEYDRYKTEILGGAGGA